MSNLEQIQLFGEKQIRTAWNDAEEKWYFSVIDIIAALVETDRPRKYWSDLKRKLLAEGSELSEKIGQLKMKSSDGKMYATDVADQEQLFRLVQSIPSSKVEPIKLWIARVASERIDEIIDPEISIDRASICIGEKDTQRSGNASALQNYINNSSIFLHQCINDLSLVGRVPMERKTKMPNVLKKRRIIALSSKIDGEYACKRLNTSVIPLVFKG